MIHLPTGLKQESQCRSRQNSFAEAETKLLEKLDELGRSQALGLISKDRKDQVGSGMRGDKIRTYREQDDQVTDHRTGARSRLSLILRGELERLNR